MRQALLQFWAFVLETWGQEEIDEMCYWHNYDDTYASIEISEDGLSQLSEKEVEEYFTTLIDIYMDVSATDNYGEVQELLEDVTDLSSQEIDRLLG